MCLCGNLGLLKESGQYSTLAPDLKCCRLHNIVWTYLKVGRSGRIFNPANSCRYPMCLGYCMHCRFFVR